SDPLPPEYFFNLQTQAWQPNPFWSVRLSLVPNPNEPIILGGLRPDRQLRIPLQPGVPYLQQVWKPNDSSRRLLASYARFVARKYEVLPDHPDWKLKS